MRVVAVLALLCCGVLGAGEGVRITPPQTKGGLTCRVSGVSASTTLTVEGGQRQSHAVVSLAVRGAAGYALDQPAISAVLDEREQDIRIAPQRADEPAEYARQRLEAAFHNAAHRDERHEENITATANLRRMPERFETIAGSLSAVVAKSVVRGKVRLEAMAEAVEVAPGVTFLLASVEPAEGSRTMGYEVRVRRGRPGVTPGLEPVFAGLQLRDAQGQLLQNFHYGQPVETRDEYIYVAKNLGVSEQHLQRGAVLEVCVYDGLERLTFDFAVTGLRVATPEAGVRK